MDSIVLFGDNFKDLNNKCNTVSLFEQLFGLLFSFVSLVSCWYDCMYTILYPSIHCKCWHAAEFLMNNFFLLQKLRNFTLLLFLLFNMIYFIHLYGLLANAFAFASPHPKLLFIFLLFLILFFQNCSLCLQKLLLLLSLLLFYFFY